MSDEMLQKTIDLVSSLEAKSETQQIAKYELIEYAERLHEENQELKKIINKTIIALVNIDGDLPYSKESDKICNLIDTLRLVK